MREHGGLQAPMLRALVRVEKMADERGLMRGVKRLMVEAGGGAIIGQMRCGSSKEPAARGDGDATGLGNACTHTAGCGVVVVNAGLLGGGGGGSGCWVLVVLL